MRILTGIALFGFMTGAAVAAPRPVVVELFTSQGCSDCPPADSLLRHVQATDPDVLALDLHVTYWDSAAWTDPFSLQSATRLQHSYAALGPNPEIYTPEAVVDGRVQFVGSDRDAMTAAIEQAKARINKSSVVPVSVAASGGRVSVRVESAKRSAGVAEIWLFGFDPEHTTRIAGGENGGAALTEVNVVRSATKLATWNGRVFAQDLAAPPGMKFAVVLQRADGAILGAATSRNVTRGKASPSPDDVTSQRRLRNNL